MADLVEFLRARLDEDETVARAAIADDGSQDGGFEDADFLTNGRTRPGFADAAAAMIRTFAVPRRVLREVEAKRRMFNEVFAYEAKIDGEWGCCHSPKQIADGMCPETKPEDITALCLLAPPYANHRDYREEWRP